VELTGKPYHSTFTSLFVKKSGVRVELTGKPYHSPTKLAINTLKTLQSDHTIILIHCIFHTNLIQQFYKSVVVILNNAKPNGIPLRSKMLC